MKASKLLGVIAASLFVFAACGDKEDDPGVPPLSVDPAELSVQVEGGASYVTVVATRDWTATTDAEWIAVEPSSGKGNGKDQLVTVTTLANSGLDREGTVTFTIGFEDRTLTVSQKGEAGSAEAKTVAEFISAANTSTYYKLTGTVSGFNSQYCSFDLTDDTGTIYVYSVDNKSDWSSVIKNDGTVTLAGKYANYSAKSQHEVVNAQIISFTEGTSGGGDTDTASGSGTLADPYNPKAAYDAAAALASGAVSDNDIYVKGKISSAKYYFSAQFGTATFNISADGTTSGTQFTCYSVYYLGNRAWVDGDQQIVPGDEVVICGKLTNYQGNTPETASKQAYIYSLNGQTSIATGDVFGVASEAISVGASATSATVSVTGNVAWTASASDGATLSAASGTGAGDITVTFPANTSTENAVTYTVTVTTTADVTTKSYTVTITQAKVGASTGPAYTFDGSNSDTSSGSTNGYAVESEITQNGITWSVMGNTTMGPWRLGGKNLTGVDRAIYSKTALPYAIKKVEVTSGTATVTVNSLTISAHSTAEDAAAGTNALGTVTVSSGIASSTVTLTNDGDAWTNCFYRIVYNVTNASTSSNKYVQFVSAKLYE